MQSLITALKIFFLSHKLVINEKSPLDPILSQTNAIYSNIHVFTLQLLSPPSYARTYQILLFLLSIETKTRSFISHVLAM
jgi:hypothetical protein